jgi:transcriptional regulator with XRE-family HTH domain
VTFGETLRVARERTGMSQDQFGAATGIHRTHISLIERGVREPRLDTLVKLSRGLGISPTELIEWYVPSS